MPFRSMALVFHLHFKSIAAALWHIQILSLLRSTAGLPGYNTRFCFDAAKGTQQQRRATTTMSRPNPCAPHTITNAALEHLAESGPLPAHVVLQTPIQTQPTFNFAEGGDYGDGRAGGDRVGRYTWNPFAISYPSLSRQQYALSRNPPLFCQTHARRPPAVTIIDHDTLMSPPPLPSLLRYVDHDLMQIATLHNSPSEDNATCPVCSKHWNSGSTFLPLHPCGHWMHYRCLI
jgi:hypothetical protein